MRLGAIDERAHSHTMNIPPKRSTVFVVAIHHLKLPERLGIGFQILPGLLITNEFREIERNFDPAFFKVIGDLESQGLRKADAVAYTLGDPVHLQQSKVTGDQFVILAAQHIAVLLHCLWLIKDHSAYTELGFIQIPHGNQIVVHSNFLGSSITNAAGQRSTTAFSVEEMKRTTDFVVKTLPLLKYDFRMKQNPSTSTLGSQRGARRVSRAIYFTSVARGASDLGMKVVNYCTVLETLFSTDASELTHKVSQRVAVFMGGTVDEKLAIYQLVNKSYGIRSKVVHGDSIADDAIDKVESLSVELDGLVRTILTKIISSEEIAKHFDSNKEELNRTFLRASFS